MAHLRTLLLASVVVATAACDEAPRQHLPAPTAPNFTLYVSNQSFDMNVIDIRVRIDGELAITGDFDVEGQHSWHDFDFEFAQGAHVLTVTSEDTFASLEVPFTIDARKFGVLDFWYDAADDQPPTFAFDVSTERPQFQ